MKYKVKEDFLYIIDSGDDEVASLTYIFKKGEIYFFSPFNGKGAKPGDMMCDHTLHECNGEVELSMLVLDKETFDMYFIQYVSEYFEDSKIII